MKGRTIVLDHIGQREAAALLVDGKLDDLMIDTDAPRPGTIYRAVAERPVKGQGGMFLKTPDGSAFLRQVKGLSPGQKLLVQVQGYAEEGKALPVSQKLLFKSRYAIVTPGAPGLNISRNIRDEDERDRLLEIAHEAMAGADFGLILRSSCEGRAEEDIADDISAMRGLAESVFGDTGTEMETLTEGDGPHALAWRDWVETADVHVDKGAFDTLGVSDQLHKATTSQVSLDNGAKMFIEPTRALVAVDVNTGHDTSLAAGLKANLSCAQSLPRALRLRGLGGQIVLDLAPFPKKDRRQVETALRRAFKQCDIETALVGWTPLGHFELQRKRARLPLAELIS